MASIQEQRDALSVKITEKATEWRNLGEKYNESLDKGEADTAAVERRAGWLEERRGVREEKASLEEKLAKLPVPRNLDAPQLSVDDLSVPERFMAFGHKKLGETELKDYAGNDLRTSGNGEGIRMSIDEFHRLAAINTDNAVGVDVEPGLIRARNYYGNTASLVRQFNDEFGSERIVVAQDDSSQKGEWVAATAPATRQDGANPTKVTFSQFRVTSKAMSYNRVSERDVRAYQVGAEVARDGMMRLGRAFEEKFINGSGTDEPRGLLASAKDFGTKAAANTGYTVDELVNLRKGINKGYRITGPDGRYGYINNPGSGAIAYLGGDDLEFNMHAIDNSQLGRRNPKFRPSMDPNMPDTWDGVPVYFSGEMPDFGSNSFSVIYMNGAYYGARFIRDVEMRRWDSDDPTILANEVRYLVQTWADGLPVGGKLTGTTRTAYVSDAWVKLQMAA